MAELITGKLWFDQDKRKWQVEFFNEKKQQPSKMFCDAGEISTDIPKNEAEQFDVQFERKPPHGEPIQIRLAGTAFIAPSSRRPTAPPPMAQRQENAPLQREARDTPRERIEQRRERTNDDMSREFHNPYNFVPALPRPNETLGGLGDREPSGHDRFHAELLSGKLGVTMTVETPLLLMDTAKVEVQKDDSNYAKKGHKTFPVRVDSDGKPEINPTAVKGMLRSAYEAITNSRLSVFQGHDERLAFRGDVREGLFVVPARIESNKIVLYTGASEIRKDGSPTKAQYAAMVKMYEVGTFVNEDGKNVFAIARDRVIPNDDVNRPPFHSNKAWAWIEEFSHRSGKFTYWRVMGLAYEEKVLGDAPTPSPDAISSSPRKVEGYVCNTGKTMKGKHDERFFFGKTTEYDIDLEPLHIEYWNRLIKDYRQEHEKDFDSPPKEGQDRNKYSLEWSRHIQKTELSETSRSGEPVFEKLKDGTLCYARVEWNGGSRSFDVVELYPVMISRHLNPVAPETLLPMELGTARFITQLSTADRVFGWVRQSRPKKDDETQHEKAIPEHLKILGAYRGQIRIGAIDCISDKADAIQSFSEAVPLQILGQPKPQQGRFYVAEEQSGEAQIGPRDNENAGYKTTRGLRGRKVYPHHKLPGGYWDNPNQQWGKPLLDKYFQEFRRPNGDDQRDKQNRSASGWVKPETVFKFDIHFINLSQVELGALLWLLKLPKEHFHRFGGGKPLGFGSVTLVLEGTEISNGEELKKRYFTLNEEDLAGRPELTGTCVEAFEREVVRAYDKASPKVDELTPKQITESSQKISFVQAFLNAAKGFDDLPVHYPRAKHDRNPGPVPPHADGLAYEWFVENAKKPNADNPQTQFVLPNLFEAKVQGLPILYHKPRGRR